jgi:hypothetical protein
MGNTYHDLIIFIITPFDDNSHEYSFQEISKREATFSLGDEGRSPSVSILFLTGNGCYQVSHC